MSNRLIIGLMSGTSVDAIDAALVKISGNAGRHRAKVLAHLEHRWPAALRARLLAIMAPANTATQEICELNFLVARQFAAATLALLQREGISPKTITALASHGQTICHLPPKGGRHTARPKAAGSTLQLGDASVLATLTGIPTVGNFRPADMAAGGQGAPLVPWADDALLAHPTKTRCVQNIGGIANVTFLPPLDGGKARPPVIAFDTGPGNMLLDAAVTLLTSGRQSFDKNGRLAAKGSLDAALFRQLQAHDYFSRRPPKSTGREDFGMPFAKKLLASIENQKSGAAPAIGNILHTLTRLTAWSIADAYLHFLPRLPDEVILCGGGADNPVLVRMLQEELATLTSDFTQPHPPKLLRIDDFGIPNKAKEAASFALLAAATLDGIPGNLPSVTGAARPVILGVVARPG